MLKKKLFPPIYSFEEYYTDSCIPYPRDIQTNIDQIKQEMEKKALIFQFSKNLTLYVKKAKDKAHLYASFNSKIMLKRPYKYDLVLKVPIRIMKFYSVKYTLFDWNSKLPIYCDYSKPLEIYKIVHKKSNLKNHVDITTRIEFNVSSCRNKHAFFMIMIILENRMTKEQIGIFGTNAFKIYARKIKKKCAPQT